MAGRPPSELGVMIREALYHGGARTITELRTEINLIRRERGASPIARKSLSRLLYEAERQGLVEKVGTVRKAPARRVASHPELNVSQQYKLVMKKYSSPKWIRLNEIVAGHI